MQKNETETFCPASPKEWRKWLKENHRSKQSVWLIYYKVSSGIPSLSWSEAVDQAICFGWIDSTKKTLDDQRFMQFFCKRKPNSMWSKINKEKVQRLIDKKQMAKAGLDCIETAKQNGSWTIIDHIEELTIPSDLETAFKKNPGSKEHFMGLSKSVKKIFLHQLAMAKKPETRQKRISEITALADKKNKP